MLISPMLSFFTGIVPRSLPLRVGAITARAELTDGYYVVASSNGLAAMSHTNAGTFFTSKSWIVSWVGWGIGNSVIGFRSSGFYRKIISFKRLVHR